MRAARSPARVTARSTSQPRNTMRSSAKPPAYRARGAPTHPLSRSTSNIAVTQLAFSIWEKSSTTACDVCARIHLGKPSEPVSRFTKQYSCTIALRIVRNCGTGRGVVHLPARRVARRSRAGRGASSPPRVARAVAAVERVLQQDRLVPVEDRVDRVQTTVREAKVGRDRVEHRAEAPLRRRSNTERGTIEFIIRGSGGRITAREER